jgi:transcriptional regulator with XRE-family HTH domain
VSEVKGDEMAKFKSNLQAMRKRAGFKSAREFALHANIPVDTYTAYEQGKTNMTLLQAWEFADMLNCTLDELAGRKSPNVPDGLTADEQTIVDGYRTADDGQRLLMKTMANAVIEKSNADAREKKEAI